MCVFFCCCFFFFICLFLHLDTLRMIPKTLHIRTSNTLPSVVDVSVLSSLFHIFLPGQLLHSSQFFVKSTSKKCQLNDEQQWIGTGFWANECNINTLHKVASQACAPPRSHITAEEIYKDKDTKSVCKFFLKMYKMQTCQENMQEEKLKRKKYLP